MDFAKMESQLIQHEAIRLRPYTDTVGKLTIGVGRNLTDRGISKIEALFMLRNDIASHWKELVKALPWVQDLDEVRQRAMLDLAFNMGVPTLLTFKQTLPAIREGRYEEAAALLRRSKWYRDVKSGRGDRIREMIRTGKDYA